MRFFIADVIDKIKSVSNTAQQNKWLGASSKILYRVPCFASFLIESWTLRTDISIKIYEVTGVCW